MIKNFLLIAFFTISMSGIFAQKKEIGCGVKLSPKEQEAYKKAILKNKQLKSRKGVQGSYKIPVVFHVLNNGGSVTRENMECRINDVMKVVNKDFRGEFPGYNSTDPRFDAVKSKMENIEFILAKEDPDGNLLEYPGMNWLADSNLVQDGYDTKITGDQWWWGKNGKYYLQVFIVSHSNGMDEGEYQSGHAFLPVQDAFPRVVFNWRYVGRASACPSNPSESNIGFEKVMTHEFGHYFGLKHTFNGSNKAEGTWTVENDGIDDTPPTLGSEGCTRDVLNVPGVYPNLENHMDYNTSCQNMFTVDQVAMMNMWLEDTNTAPHPRSLLWQPNNLIATGITPRVPTAIFTSDETAVCINKNVIFNDISTGLPSSRLWTFEGGTPATSTAINPTVTYSTAGRYKVTLQVTNTSGTNTTEAVNYIDVDQYTTTDTTEDFSGVFPAKGWTITNPDGKLAWEKRTDVGNGDSSCIIMNNADNAVTGEEDYLRLPFYDFTSATKAQMYFDVAYVKFDANSPDILKVEVSTDCGTSWNEVYSKTHLELETTISALSPNDWIPNEESHWRKEIVDLSAYDGTSNLTFRFKNISGYGTRIWLDNVTISLKNDVAPETDFYTKTRNSLCSSEQVEFFDTSNATPTSWAWEFPGGTPATSNLQNPIVDYNSAGSYDVTLTATNIYGSTSVTKTAFVVLKTPKSQSFTEDFSGTFPPTDWQIRNFDSGLEFEQGNAGNGDNLCMIMNNADNSTVGELDEILLPSLDLSVGATDFYFDVAYTKFDNDSPDKLKVLASKDCGVTWVTLYEKTHTELETTEVLDNPGTPNNEANDWIPSLPEHWRKERVILNDYQGESNVLVKFVNESGYGTRIWIDNVTLTTDSKETPISNFEKEDKGICQESSVQFTDSSTGIPTVWSWKFEGGTPAIATEQNPLVTYSQPGVYKVELTASNTYGTGTTTIKTSYITVKGTNSLPYTENFEGAFPIADWEIINPDNDEILWEKRSDAGNGDTSCLVINNADNPTDKVDELILKPFDFSNQGDKKMEFDIAYTKYNNATDPNVISPDNLIILISTNCGTTWTEVYNKNQNELQTFEVLDDPATVDDNEANDWIPTLPAHWRKETIDLNTFDGNPNVLVKLKNISGYGTRIWIDNLSLNSTVDNTYVTWTGNTDNDWNTSSNWNTNTVPSATSIITIPNGLINYPTANTSVNFNTLTISSGASFIPQNTVTGEVTYRRNIPTTNWHLISSPVAGETIEDFITNPNHTFASGTNTNIGIAPFNNDNLTSAWNYLSAASTGAIETGKGYSVKLANTGYLSFTGTLNTVDINMNISNGSRNSFNLLGNPFSAYVSSAMLTSSNTLELSEETVWLWNGTEYIAHNALNPIQIAPAQGFFIEANANPATNSVSFATSNQTHQNGDTFKRETPKQFLELFVENGASKKSTKVFYVANKTTGFDNGYDSKIFGGVSNDFELFTELLTDNKGNKLEIQSLPNSNIETMVVPIGLTTEGRKELTFSINTQNFPEGINVYLEDRLTNTFVNLSEQNHKTVIETAIKGIGQFYIHTTSKKLDDLIIKQDLQNISIYKSANNNLTITGLQTDKASLNMFSILGKKIISTQFKSTGVHVIQLPETSVGIYIIELTSSLGKINKKIIIE
ncbi:PKD domain-containing protein [Tenacibaculum ovolyticum]|uniref:PKD domain-containing protein n=1 Tax=Tenacibaculum ovolyticum TaxID=104270 RepID=UPI0022F3AFEA|nr:PKD domain-containing protein [Tenacibaculum ovolyticum]WBX75001.1 PKD domain-containing protein [Tenacibaculum ovolyticum]